MVYKAISDARANWRLFPGTGNHAWLSNVDGEDKRLYNTVECTVGFEDEETADDYHEFLGTSSGTSNIGVVLKAGTRSIILLLSFETDVIEISDLGITRLPEKYATKGIPDKYFKYELTHWINSLTMKELVNICGIKVAEKYVAYAIKQERG